MFDIGFFKIENGNVIGLNTHKITVRIYDDFTKTTYTDKVHYVDSEGFNEWTENIVSKHQLYEIMEIQVLDTSEYEWMDGITLKTGNRAKEISEIASYGSLEAYQASLPESQDEFNLDVDYRISKIELGI